MNQPYEPPIRRRVHWYAPPAIGNSEASSAYTASSRHWPASATGSTHSHAGPATSVPTNTTAYSPTTGEMAAKPNATLSKIRRRRSSSCR